MLKALIIDDEQRASDLLQLMIGRFVPVIERVWCCNDARQATQQIHSLRPDLVFLDIRMPYLDGFEVLDQIRDNTRVEVSRRRKEEALQQLRLG